MTVVEPAALTLYTAFTTEDGKPPAFAIFTSDEALVFPYAHLYGVGWLKGDKGHQILLEHRFFRVYIHGNHLEPLLAEFERFTVRTVHVFDSGRHAAVGPGDAVVTHIDDHYGK
jgi:hypothetical protein